MRGRETLSDLIPDGEIYIHYGESQVYQKMRGRERVRRDITIERFKELQYKSQGISPAAHRIRVGLDRIMKGE